MANGPAVAGALDVGAELAASLTIVLLLLNRIASRNTWLPELLVRLIAVALEAILISWMSFPPARVTAIPWWSSRDRLFGQPHQWPLEQSITTTDTLRLPAPFWLRCFAMEFVSCSRSAFDFHRLLKPVQPTQ